MRHRPPAVSFFARRSRWHGVFLSCVAGGALTALPALMGVSSGFSWAAVGWQLVVTLLCLVSAAATWWRSPQGWLRWDGMSWSWSPAEDAAMLDVRVVFDFQSLLLISLRREGQQPFHLWLERSNEQARQWSALRRALVYAQKRAIPAQGRDTPHEDVLS